MYSIIWDIIYKYIYENFKKPTCRCVEFSNTKCICGRSGNPICSCVLIRKKREITNGLDQCDGRKCFVGDSQAIPIKIIDGRLPNLIKAFPNWVKFPPSYITENFHSLGFEIGEDIIDEINCITITNI